MFVGQEKRGDEEIKMKTKTMKKYEDKETELVLCMYEQKLIPKEDILNYIKLRQLIDYIIEEEIL